MFNLSLQRLTPESYAQKLKDVLSGTLKSVILYGSATTGEFVSGKSDYNVLLILEQLGILELNLISKVTQQWLKEGNPPPLLFTAERLQCSTDCFPIEMLDMKQSYRLVLGDDVLKDLKVMPVHLQLMTERELKSLKIQLREGFMYAAGNFEKVAKLMTETLSSTLALFRAALRLYTDAVPTKKYEVLPAIAEKVAGVDVETFMTLRALKHGEISARKLNVLQLFEKYMNSIVLVADAVDARGKGA